MCMQMVAPVLGLVGGIVQSRGIKAKANQDAANLDAQAAAQKEQAAATQLTGAYKAQRKQDEVERVLGSQRAAYAGSGIALSGSALDVIEESATEGALDVAAIRWNTGAEAATQRHNAEVSTTSAKATRKAGKTASIAPIIGGVAQFASGFSSAVSSGFGK